MSSNSISATEKDFSREPPPMKSLVKILGFLMQQPSSFVLEQLRVIDGIGLNETQGKQSLLRDDSELDRATAKAETDLQELYGQYRRSKHNSPALYGVLQTQVTLKCLTNLFQDGSLKAENRILQSQREAHEVNLTKRGGVQRRRRRRDPNTGELMPLSGTMDMQAVGSLVAEPSWKRKTRKSDANGMSALAFGYELPKRRRRKRDPVTGDLIPLNDNDNTHISNSENAEIPEVLKSGKVRVDVQSSATPPNHQPSTPAYQRFEDIKDSVYAQKILDIRRYLPLQSLQQCMDALTAKEGIVLDAMEWSIKQEDAEHWRESRDSVSRTTKSKIIDLCSDSKQEMGEAHVGVLEDNPDTANAEYRAATPGDGPTPEILTGCHL